MQSDRQLIKSYIETGKEDVFQILVSRYIGLSSNSAMRITQQRELAQEIVQDVFTLLAQKAPSLIQHPSIGGWVIKTTTYIAKRELRNEQNRLRKLNNYQNNLECIEQPDSKWLEISPHLDQALVELNKSDLQVVVMRFFEKKKYRQIGEVTGSSEDSIRMQVKRALEKLAKSLQSKGIATSSLALGLTLESGEATEALLPEISVADLTHTALTISQGAESFGVLTKILTIMTNTTALKVTTAVALIALIPITIQWKNNQEEQLVKATTSDSTNPHQSEMGNRPKRAQNSARTLQRESKIEKQAQAQLEKDRIKQVDRKNLTAIHGGIMAFFAHHGRYPNYLSEMVPDFIPVETLISPREKTKGANMLLAMDHEDPGLKKSSYGYEYSNLIVRDNRTFQEIKDVQKAEWGNVVPLLRAFGNDKVINMSWGGDLYETDLMWEYGESTLELVDQYGWGPGMDAAGNKVEVSVTNEAGFPILGAEVWAGGRNYSFPLPERPFVTDERGIATIPIGPDASSTNLTLRVSSNNHAVPSLHFENGVPPESIELVAKPTQQVSGTLLDKDGNPMPDTRVTLIRLSDENGGTPLIVDYTRTDTNGNWRARVPPEETEGITAVPRFP